VGAASAKAGSACAGAVSAELLIQTCGRDSINGRPIEIQRHALAMHLEDSTCNLWWWLVDYFDHFAIMVRHLARKRRAFLHRMSGYGLRPAFAAQ